MAIVVRQGLRRVNQHGFGHYGVQDDGRRADGWLPMLMVPGPPEQPAGLLRQRRAIDESAERAGRDPGAIATIVRVNAAAGTTPQAIADAVRRLVDETGFDDLFIDPLYLADSVDGALELALQLLKLLASVSTDLFTEPFALLWHGRNT